MSVPKTVVEIFRSVTSRMKRGLSVSASKAERFRAVVSPSIAPASMCSQWLCGRTCLARAS